MTGDEITPFEEFLTIDLDKEVDAFIEGLFEQENEPVYEPEPTPQQEPVVQQVGEAVSREEALAIAQDTLLHAEKERSEAVEQEAAQHSNEDPYEEQYQFFMQHINEGMQRNIVSFMFMDGQDSVTFSIESDFKKQCKAFDEMKTKLQECFDDLTWSGKKIIIEVIKKCKDQP